jgi:large subunit ribosomal protein L4
MALSAKARSGALTVLDNLDVKEGKTRELVARLAKLNLGKALFIDGEAINISFARASSNIVGVDVLPAIGANVYDILRADSLVLTRAAVEKLEARFNG